MPEYRRAFAPGGTFFFTLVTERRQPLFADATARVLLRRAFAFTMRRWPLTLDAIVLLPDHLHTIWTLPDGDSDFSTRWSALKRVFTQSWLGTGGPEQPRSASRRHNRRRGVWQRRFWEHLIRDETDFERHCDYIHYNPVKHGLVRCPHEWPYSSFRRFVRDGRYEADWACACRKPRREPPGMSEIGKTAME
jgi:putative transposase